MDLRLFTGSASGKLIETVDANGNKGISFLPDPLPPSVDFGSKVLRQALSKADQGLARLDGAARQIERPDLLFRNYLRREAVLSTNRRF